MFVLQQNHLNVPAATTSVTRPTTVLGPAAARTLTTTNTIATATTLAVEDTTTTATPKDVPAMTMSAYGDYSSAKVLLHIHSRFKGVSLTK